MPFCMKMISIKQTLQPEMHLLPLVYIITKVWYFILAFSNVSQQSTFGSLNLHLF